MNNRHLMEAMAVLEKPSTSSTSQQLDARLDLERAVEQKKRLLGQEGGEDGVGRRMGWA